MDSRKARPSRLSLSPGETKTVNFTLSFNELSFLNRDMKRVVEPGRFEVMVGTSSNKLSTVALDVVR